MSTCPDSDLYSAWVDGEVPSPWKEKLEAHMSHCPDCKKRSERYRGLHIVMQKSAPGMDDAQLEASYERLLVKRQAALAAIRFNHDASVDDRRDSRFREWARVSVSLPLPALAALLAVAVFIPSWFAMHNAGPANHAAEYAVIPTIQQSGDNGMRALATSNSVYSPDLPPDKISVNLIDPESKQYFTMIDFARQFTDDKDLFSQDADIIIIKLPTLAHFNATENQFIEPVEPLKQAAGFYK